MAFGRRSDRVHPTTTTTTTHHTTTAAPRRTTKPSLMSRLRGTRTSPRRAQPVYVEERPGHHHHHHHHNGRHDHVVVAEPVHHHKRKTSVGDKVSGAMMKLEGKMTRRPGLKAAGTRRMRGTDGRGARKYY